MSQADGSRLSSLSVEGLSPPSDYPTGDIQRTPPPSQAPQPAVLNYAKKANATLTKSRAAAVVEVLNLASTHARTRRPLNFTEQTERKSTQVVEDFFVMDDLDRSCSPNTTRLLTSSENSPISEAKATMRSRLDACEGFARAARLGRTSRWPSYELELEAEGDTDAAWALRSDRSTTEWTPLCHGQLCHGQLELPAASSHRAVDDTNDMEPTWSQDSTLLSVPPFQEPLMCLVSGMHALLGSKA